MRGTEFPEAVTKLKAPEGMEDEVYSLPVWTDGQHPALISKWKMTWKERFMCLIQGHVWLHVLSQQHPPVTIETSFPFVERKDSPGVVRLRRIMKLLIGVLVVLFIIALSLTLTGVPTQ